jgi:hypothetical protein
LMSFLSFDSNTVGMRWITWLYFSCTFVAQAAPLARNDALEVRDNANIAITTGAPPKDRTIFVVVAMFCTTILAFLLGTTFPHNSIRKRD